MDLKGKWVLVTGSGKRVGREIVLAFARAGANVVVHYRLSPADANATADDARKLGVQARTAYGDLADPAGIDKLFEQIKADPGRLDVLVNNASLYSRTPIETLTAEEMDADAAVNVRAPALCTRHAAELMTDGGAIINMADIVLEKPRAHYIAYVCSKAAVIGLTLATAKALAPRGIRVNAIAPGIAEFPADAPAERREMLLEKVPLHRAGGGEAIGQAAVFLASHDYITGEILRVDGGWHLV